MAMHNHAGGPWPRIGICGRIIGIEPAGHELKLRIALPPPSAAILNDALWKIRDSLDIEQFEFNRHHWAIKDRDLFAVLAESGHSFDPSVVSRFVNKPLPAPSRS